MTASCKGIPCAAERQLSGIRISDYSNEGRAKRHQTSVVKYQGMVLRDLG